VWTKDLIATDETMMLPIAHGEGRFVASTEALERIERDNLVVVR